MYEYRCDERLKKEDSERPPGHESQLQLWDLEVSLLVYLKQNKKGRKPRVQNVTPKL
jgi:hypothetical protein